MPWETLTNSLASKVSSPFKDWLARLVRAIEIYVPRFGARRVPQQRPAFTTAFVALAAKMAAADGVAVHVEAEAFERFLEVDPGERDKVKRLYDLAKQDSAGYEIYAERIGSLLASDPQLRRDVLECLICVACSDGILHPAEDGFLHVVSRHFGFSEAEWRQVRALFVHEAGNPYEILGLEPGVSDVMLKARYRKLVSELHPDRLVASGAPPVKVKAANAKLATINEAYDVIVAERRQRGSRL
jgi:DnaJ like chaperone protein